MNMNFQLNFVSVPTPSSTPTPITKPPTPTTPTTTSSAPQSQMTTSTTTPPIITSATSSCSSPSSLMSTPMSSTTSTTTTTTTISTLPCSTPSTTTTSTPSSNNSLLAGNSIHLNYNTTNGDSNLDDMVSKSCAGCRQTIVDRYYLVFDDRNWHSRCLTCNECGCTLERRCFVRNGLIYCKLDYHRLFSFRTCAKCCTIIEPHQLVMKVNSGHFYHIDCFTCSQCYCILHKNDYYGLIEGKIYCSDHYSLLLRETALQSLTISSNNNTNPPTPTPNNLNGGNNLNHLNHNLNSTNSLTNHRGPSSLSSASPVSSLSSPSSSLSINYHQQQQSQPQPPHLHQLAPHHLPSHHHHQQPLHLLQQNVLNSTNPISPISNHLHHLNHLNSTTPTANNHLNHHHLLGGGTNIKSEPLFNSSNGNSHKSSTEPVVQVRQTTRGRPRRKLKKEPLECNNNTANSNTANDNLSYSIENQHQPPPSHLIHPPPTSTSSTNSSSTSSSHTENVFHDHLHGLGCPVDSLPGNLHEPRLGLNKSPSCPLPGLNGQSTNGNHGGGGNTTNGGGSSNGSNNSKSKRVRTSFKHAQLKTMKSYFAINQNPDAKDLKGLAAKTGLSKRVLQVWFQNARAKWRKTSANTKKDSNSETAIVDTSSQHSQHHQHHESSGSFSIDYYCKEPFESTGDCDDTLIHHLHSNSLTAIPSSHLNQSQQSQLHMPHQFEQSQTQLPHHPPSLSSTDDEDLNNL